MRSLWRDLPLSVKGLTVVAIPVVPLLVTALLYFQNEAASREALRNTDRTARNRQIEAALFTEAVAAESGVRGYLLSGDASLLANHRQARGAVARLVDELDANTVDPQQRQMLPRLDALLRDRLDALDAVLRAHATSGVNSPEMLEQVRRGAGTMRALREHLDLIGRRNRELLLQRNARAEALRARTTSIVTAGTLAGVGGGVIAAVLFTTGITRRVAAATRDVARLAAGERLAPVDPARDEIGTLTTGMHRASELLAHRDEQLQQRMAELESLTRELEAFSYSVSHDLRAPLRHMASFAALLEKSAGSTFTDQQRRYTRTIVEAGAHMGRLIDDLLAFSRTGRAELRRQAVNLRTVIADVQRQLAGEIHGRQVDWVVRPLPTVQGDPALLRIVFDNLLANAVKYTRPRERAVIEIGVGPGAPGEAVIYVRDNGVGFDMQYGNKLFGVFQRLHSSDQFEGTGIGLATVQRIVTRHGGRAWAEGRPNEGATFSVALPAEGAAA